MTREEAINHIKTVAKSAIDSGYDSAVVDAVSMAKEALEQEPCDDCISRQAALDCLTATKLKKFDFILQAREELKKLPSVTSQPKTGHWKKMVSIYDVVSGTYTRVTYTDEDKKMGNMPIYECECGRTMPMPTNYCPDCGAKMEEDKEWLLIYAEYHTK